jgi:hypothetical protein
VKGSNQEKSSILLREMFIRVHPQWFTEIA